MYRTPILAAVAAAAALSASAHATFHLVQVEQIVGGVNGDSTAQAIQLRFSAAGQHLQSGGRFRVWDAAGANPIVISDAATNLAGPSQTGDRVLFASASFASYLDSAITIDYTMSALIPASYLVAGSLTFETNNGATIYWRVSWGGAGYTGSNSGSVTNDADGNFGPPIASGLPSTGATALLFQGSATALSSNNAADYSETAPGATFTNYLEQSASLVVAPPTGACCMTDGSCSDAVAQAACEAGEGTYQGDDSACATVECTPPADCIADAVDSGTFQPPPDGQVDGADLAFLLGEWGPNPGSPADIVDSATFQPPPDGLVDGADLAFLLGSWGPCR